MSAVLRHRSAGPKYSLVTYVLYAAARVLAAHPQANAAISRRGYPRLARYPSVNGKFTLDKTLNGERIVLSAVLPNLHESTLEEIQRQVAHYRDGDPATMPEFRAARLLHRLPWPIGGVLFRLGVRPLNRRATVLGTFAVTSLGHRPVDGSRIRGVVTAGAPITEFFTTPHGRTACPGSLSTHWPTSLG
jgi:hypothetical protein